MPTYKLPPLPKSKKAPGAVAIDEPQYVFPDKWERTIRIPVSSEQLEVVKAGGKVALSLYGTVTEVTNEERVKERSRKQIEVVLTEVEVYAKKGKNTFEKIAEEDM